MRSTTACSGSGTRPSKNNAAKSGDRIIENFLDDILFHTRRLLSDKLGTMEQAEAWLAQWVHPEDRLPEAPALVVRGGRAIDDE